MDIQVWESSTINGPVDQLAFNLTSFQYDSKSDEIIVLTDIDVKNFAQMTDDGNGVEINIKRKKIKLDYYECVQVLILLQSKMDQRFQFKETKTIKSF